MSCIYLDSEILCQFCISESFMPIETVIRGGGGGGGGGGWYWWKWICEHFHRIRICVK